MYVWQGETPTEFEVLTVDSVTFADAESQWVFSVSADKQVRFSTGNLQYTQSTQTWSFAAQQYEFIGTDNVADGSLADKIDLFGWSGSTALQNGISALPLTTMIIAATLRSAVRTSATAPLGAY